MGRKGEDCPAYCPYVWMDCCPCKYKNCCKEGVVEEVEEVKEVEEEDEMEKEEGTGIKKEK